MQTGNVLLILLLSASALANASAQIANPNSVAFHEQRGVKPISEPPAALRQTTAELSGSLVGQPFPAPIDVRQIVQGTSVSYQKEEVMTIQPGEKLQIILDTQPVVMEKIKAALQSENGASARSFKARVRLALLSRSPSEPGGRSVSSDWLSFSF